MDYQIKSGDCLWTIVQDKYKLTDDAQISNKVNEIFEANRQKGLMGDDINFLADGQSIFLPDEGVSGGTKADEFHSWGNKQNDGSEFEMFNIQNVNAQTYAVELEKFSQEYINKFDTDKDGSWNENEFIAMATGGAQLDESTRAEYHKLFENLNMDENAGSISAKEYATQLFAADDKNGQLDGKFTMNDYLQAFKSNNSGDIMVKNKKASFYKNNYMQQPQQLNQPQQQNQPTQTNFRGLTA